MRRQDKTLQSNRLLKPEKFQADDTDAEVRRNTFARLSSYFGNGFLRASEEIGERPFLFSGDCPVVSWGGGGVSSDRPQKKKTVGRDQTRTAMVRDGRSPPRFRRPSYAGQLKFDIIPWKLHEEAEGSEDSVLALCDEARVTARTIHSIETSKFHRRMNVFRGGRATAHHCAGRVTCTHVLSKGF